MTNGICVPLLVIAGFTELLTGAMQWTLVNPERSRRISAEHQASASQSNPEEMVLDGSKNPELLPEWFVWEHTFQSLSHASTSNRRIPLHRELGISEAEVAYLLAEVKTFKQAEATLAKQLVEIRAAGEARHQTEDQVRDATQAANLAYRYKVLEASQRVLERLTTQSLIGLRLWMNQLIQGTEVHLRGRAIQFFKQPR